MTALWFGLAVACLAGAGALLYFDRLRKMRTGRVRQAWAKSHGYSYKVIDPSLPGQWRRATLAKQGYLSAVDVASGTRRGVRFTLFDLEDAATIVAVQRRIGSDVDIDLRLKSTPPPKDPDLELLGAMGDHVVFATDIDVARRVADQRMAALAEILPENLQVLWSENTWTLGSLPVTATTRDWDQAIDGVIRFSGLLHVLPPEGEQMHRPLAERRAERQAAEDPAVDEAEWENAQRYQVPRRGLTAVDFEPVRAEQQSEPYESEGYEDEEPEYQDLEDDGDLEDDDAEDDHVETQPGGPFHPGFRPYQGPSAR